MTEEPALRRIADLAAEFEARPIADAARSAAERVSEGRFYVACVGFFKRGKSTLLNALLGHPVLPTGILPVTTVPTILRYGSQAAARLRLQDAEWTDIPVNSLEDYVSEEKNPENVKKVAALEIFLPHPFLSRGMCFVDTPGLGSVFAGNTAATHAFIPHIDAAIVVSGADPPLSGEELQFVEIVAREARELLFVLNKADRVGETELATASAFARGVLESRLRREVPAIFEVSALERLEHRGPGRDWGRLLSALEHLSEQSGRSLVREATVRALQRAARQLLAVIQEERDAMQRPLMDSERRIAELRKTLDHAGRAMQDLRYLLSGEQLRLSSIFAGRRTDFLKQAQAGACKELHERLPLVSRRRNGASYRRDVMHLAQEIAHAWLAPWLENEGKFAEEGFRETAERFAGFGNEFLRRLRQSGFTDMVLLPQELSLQQGLWAESQFRFHTIERVAAPASPFLYVADLARGVVGLRGWMAGDAEAFLDLLLEVNSARVQNDVDERVRESRRKLEEEVRSLVDEAVSIAERALARAQVTHAAGAESVAAACARLDVAEGEVRELCPSL